MSHFKMAVVIIHGMGSQFTGTPLPSSAVTFSRELHKRVGRFVGPDLNRVAWREIVWAHVLQPRQNRYLRKIKRRTGYDDVREFVVHNLSDAASYRKTQDGSDKTYEALAAYTRELKSLEDNGQDRAGVHNLLQMAASTVDYQFA